MSAVRGFWKIIAISRPRTSASWLRFCREEIEAAEHGAAAGDAAGRIENAHHRIGGDRFARSGFADQRDGLALGDGEADIVQRAHDAASGCGIRPTEPSTIERRCGVHVRLRGSTMSRKPSPRRLKQNTAIISASAGKERDPPFAGDDIGGAFGDHDAPFRRRRPHAEPDERQARGVEDGVAHGQRHLHDQDREHVGQDLKGEDAPFAVAGQPRRFDEAGLAPDIGLGAGDARIEREIDDRGRQHDVLHRVAERGDDAHGEHEQRERHDGVGDAADDAVGPAAEISGGDAGQPAHQKDQRDRGNRRW